MAKKKIRMTPKPIPRIRTASATELLAKLTRGPSEHGGYGWIRDLPDARDFAYAAPLVRFPKGLPPSVDLRSECPPIYDQGQLGCCTGNGIRDGMKSVATLGAPPETDWPYDIKKFTDPPPQKAYDDAKQDLVSVYSRVAQNLVQMQGCLAEGYPFVFGFTVYDSFESQEVAASGIVPMPSPGEGVQGGHCVVAVGYDDESRTFIVRNSWGTSWGQQGYCMMPYEYLLTPQLASDFWTIRTVTG